MRPGIREKEKGIRRRGYPIALKAAAILVMQAAFFMPTAAGQPVPVRMATLTVAPGRVIHLVGVDLTGGAMELASVGAESYGRREAFDALVGQGQAMAAVNGCFFDMKTGRLVGHVYENGEARVRGTFNAAFAVTHDNRAVIAPLNELGDPYKYRTIITCVDILMKNGQILVHAKGDLVRNGHNPSRHNDIYRPARWSAIGIGRSGTVYLIVSPGRMSIYRFIKEVREHTEIVDLLGLDGGSSSGLSFEGRTVVHPARTITSVIVARVAASPSVPVALNPEPAAPTMPRDIALTSLLSDANGAISETIAMGMPAPALHIVPAPENR